MLIRTGTINELKSLWENPGSPTQTYFINNIKNGNMEFWTIENELDNSLIGELYILWDSVDKDEANGKDRAYLCAFRIDDKFRSRGLGKMLMQRVLSRVKGKGFTEVTIGADNDDSERLTAMYKSWGFTELIKLQNYDYHYIDKNSEDDGYVDFQIVKANPNKIYDMWIGFGLKPTLTGKGLGKEFVSQCVDFAVKFHNYKGDYVRLGVAEFNTRATKTYERVGFQVFNSINVEIADKRYNILWMKKKMQAVNWSI